MPINNKLHNVLYIVGLIILHTMEFIPWSYEVHIAYHENGCCCMLEIPMGLPELPFSIRSPVLLVAVHETDHGNLQSFPKQFGPNRAATIKTRFEGK